MKNKKNIIFMVIGGVTLIAITLGATYAYFTAQSGGGANIDTDVITGTTDFLSFAFGDEINIQATEENFAQGMSNLSDSAMGTAILRANNATKSATATYNIYLIIEQNDFIYTTEESIPEILLNVTDPNGNKVENITGLVHYEDGFDITTRTGGFLLIPDYEISATDTQTIQDWNIEVTFVNLDSDQNANTNKTLTGKLYLTQEQMSSYELTEINNISTTTTYNSITVTPEITPGSGAVEKYYYGIEETTSTMAYNNSGLTRLSNALAASEDVKFIESEEATHTFSNLQPNSSYTVYSYTIDENKIKSKVYSTSVTTNEYVLPSIREVSHSVTLNSITLNVIANNGSEDIVKYMYSKDNGDTWEESTSSNYTFNNLTDTTEYKIKIKVVDSNNIESTEYYETITTEIYILPVVSSVNVETTWNSITLTPSGTEGTNEIDHYEYSINNGAYQKSNLFNNLNENEEYTIRVKAIDSWGRESNVYETPVTTDTYELPIINNVTVDSDVDNITINVNATGGDGSIVSYHYSRDDGSNYETSTNNAYTFSNLTSGTTYYLKVYVTDSNGRTSTVYATTQVTYINPSISGVTFGNITNNSITVNVSATSGSNKISTYYYSNNNGESYVSSTNNSYTFDNLTPGTKYNIKTYVMDVANHKSLEETTSSYTELCSEDNASALGDCIISYYESVGSDVSDIYYHDSNLENGAGDNSYRYSGANPNNYICIGYNPCPADKLYRIIGVFDGKVKIIKADYADSTLLGTDGAYSTDIYTASNYSNYKGSLLNINRYFWNSSSSINSWDKSNLSINFNNLYNNYDGEDLFIFSSGSWYTSGNNSLQLTPKSWYNAEASGSSINASIGLMSVSDYGFAASPNLWNNRLDQYENSTITSNNWLYLGIPEWTMSKYSNNTTDAYYIDDDGSIKHSTVNSNTYGIRPAFYTNYNYLSGIGTIDNPITFQIDGCLIKGTKILLADGTYKNIEDINYDDLLAVYDHDNGGITYAYPTWIEKEKSTNSYQRITFSDGSILETYMGHSIFSADLMKYVNVNNKEEFDIGTSIFKIDENGELNKVTVTKIETINEDSYYYQVTTTRYQNVIANNFITMDTTGITTYLYSYNDDLTWGSDRAEYLESGNQFKYEDFKELFRENVFKGFRFEEAKRVYDEYPFNIEYYSQILGDNNTKPYLSDDKDNILWMVTTSDDNLSNKKDYLEKENSYYKLSQPKNKNGFIGWLNTSDNKIYQPGDKIKVIYGMHFIAQYK